jgi:hypothetical protein
MAFSFAGASSSAAGSTFSFATPAASSSAFSFAGASTPATPFGQPPSTGSLFGAASTPAAGASTSSLFGAASTPSLFGGAASTPSLFGASSTPSLFGGSSAGVSTAAETGQITARAWVHVAMNRHHEPLTQRPRYTMQAPLRHRQALPLRPACSGAPRQRSPEPSAPSRGLHSEPHSHRALLAAVSAALPLADSPSSSSSSSNSRCRVH